MLELELTGQRGRYGNEAFARWLYHDPALTTQHGMPRSNCIAGGISFRYHPGDTSIVPDETLYLLMQTGSRPLHFPSCSHFLDVEPSR